MKIDPSSSKSDDASKGIGRPLKPFGSCGPKAKRQRVKQLLRSSTEELGTATEIKLRKEGKRDSANIVKELTLASPNRGTTIKKVRIKSLHQEPSLLSPDQALALMLGTHLSTRQYLRIREQAEKINCKLYPPFYRVKEAKTMCYPRDVKVTEISAEIPLQSVIDHTIRRLCQIEDVKKKFQLQFNTVFEIIIKWGCDGSEQNKYKQKFTVENYTDENLFSVSMMTIQMHCIGSQNVIWKNSTPSSTKHCRPIKFIFAKETSSLINTEVSKIKCQIELLTPTNIRFLDSEISITPRMIFCMVDGKVINAISSCSSTQNCYLCGAKPTEMNNFEVLSTKNVKEEYLCFGISPLHAWIRLFECLLHISYRLEIRTTQIRGAVNKEKMSQRKKSIQDKFRQKLGLLVDMPKAQSGNTNDGNTARKFFRNPEISSEITGINLDIIKRFGVILECLNSGEKSIYIILKNLLIAHETCTSNITTGIACL